MARLNRNRIANVAYIAQRFANIFKKTKPPMPNLTWLHVQRSVSNCEVWSNDTASDRAKSHTHSPQSESQVL